MLDLSDRILQEGQITRDTALIGQVIKSYQAEVAQKLYVGSADRLKIVLAPQASHSVAVQQLGQGLYLDLGQVALAQRRQLAEPLGRIRQQVANLYAAASQDRSPRHYAGADLWHYFRDQLALDFPSSPDYEDHNHLLVLTDGYLDFESYDGHRQAGHRYASTRFVPELAQRGEQWPAVYKKNNYGLMPLPGPRTAALRHLQVVVAEVQPHAEYHLDILTAIWQQWLQESGMLAPQVLPRGTDLATAQETLGRAFTPRSAQPN
ncbi:hypothetical protein [Hymenobacter sp. IS2118]|uniref:hypothetical protein n=1 Tax=Hymenobacter sp. IS2118 TaxID=1505605 RepID=UPI0005577125|nr:hypothetical protein [Hymenobacter sp. IS2118]